MLCEEQRRHQEAVHEARHISDEGDCDEREQGVRDLAELVHPSFG
jgi:hypothetical protein